MHTMNFSSFINSVKASWKSTVVGCLVSECPSQFLENTLNGRYATLISLRTAQVVKCHYSLHTNHQRRYIEKFIKVIYRYAF